MNTDLTAQAVATKPSPADGATISPTQELKVDFRAGVNAKSHNVYFGTTADSLTMQAQTANKPDMKVLPLNITVSNPAEIKLPGLEEGKTYYWRVDEVWQDGTVITGQTWKFTVGKLVAHWKLDESEGSVAKDSAGGNNGTLVGNPQWQAMGGKIGGALAFDGIDDYVETNCATDLPVWTVALWVKSPAAPTQGEATGPVHREKNYQINWNHPQDAYRGSAVVFVGWVWHPASFGDLQANTWYHLAATYDGEDLKAYKDGVLITNNSDPSGPSWTESETLKLARHAMKPEFFAGTMDDVRIYNYALSEKEIAALASP